MKRASWLAVIVGLAVLGWASSARSTKNPPDTTFDSANFEDASGQPFPIDNVYSPLVPGTTFVYEGEADDGTERDVVSVTHDTKEIIGVTTTVVLDEVSVLDEETSQWKLTERTFDWYAQDKKGNVWYFGEDTTEFLDDGTTSTEGSWEAGVDDAVPGIVMLASPRVGESYRQEFAPGTAEDMAKVLRLNASVSVPYGDFDDCLKTKEWSPLERGSIGHKYYAPNVGLVLEEDLKGGHFRSELVSIVTE
jgi:hypothetical protein